MASSRPLIVRCGESGCSARATDEVFNALGEKVGNRCGVHRRELVHRLNVAEAAARNATTVWLDEHSGSDR